MRSWVVATPTPGNDNVNLSVAHGHALFMIKIGNKIVHVWASRHCHRAMRQFVWWGEALKLIKPNRKTEAQSHNKLNKNVDNSYEAPSDNSPNGRNDAKVAKQVKLKMLI